MLANSCFVSYRHLDNEAATEFIRQLHLALKNELEPLVREKIYIDQNRMTGGDFIESTISSELYKSCCMLMIFCPVYFDEDNIYCTREFLSMQKLEEARSKYASPGKGLIIPIVYKGADIFKNSILSDRKYFDFEKFTLGGWAIARNKKLNPKVVEVARYISERLSELRKQKDLWPESDGTYFVSEEAAKEWLNKYWTCLDKCAVAKFPFH